MLWFISTKIDKKEIKFYITVNYFSVLWFKALLMSCNIFKIFSTNLIRWKNIKLFLMWNIAPLEFENTDWIYNPRWIFLSRPSSRLKKHFSQKKILWLEIVERSSVWKCTGGFQCKNTMINDSYDRHAMTNHLVYRCTMEYQQKKY